MKKYLSVFNVIWLLIGFFFLIYINYWYSNESKDIKILSDVSDYEINLKGQHLILFCWLLITCFLAYRTHKNKIYKDLENDYNLQNIQLQDETKQLWKKFSDIIHYKDRDSIRKSMKVFVRSNQFVLGVQLYTYSLKYHHSFQYPKYSRKMILKLNHKESYSAEQEDLNAIIQSYEFIPLSILRQFEKAVKNRSSVKLARFIKKYNSLLQQRLSQNQEPNDEDCLIFSFLILATQHLYEELLDEDERKDIDLRNIQVKGIDNDKLYGMKRTGLSRAILDSELFKKKNSLKDIKQYYIFRNRRYNNHNNFFRAKDGRIYLARTFEFQHENHLLLLLVNPEILKEDEGYKDLFKLETSFSEVLSQHDVDLGYNNKRGEEHENK